MKYVNTILLLTVLCVDIMRHSDVFEAYYLFTFSDIHKGKNEGRCTKPLIFIYIYKHTHKQYTSDNKSSHAQSVLDPNPINITKCDSKGQKNENII